MLMLPKSRAKYIQSLHHKKFREQYGFFIAEGPKVVAELLKRQPGWVQNIYATEEWLQQQPANVLELIHTRFTQIEKFELEKISALQTPQQVLAVVAMPVTNYEQNDNWILMLDGIQDPGNLGTIIRTAYWFGIYQIVCSPDSADAFSPKVVQASMGSLFGVTVIYKDLVSFLTAYRQPVYGALLQGKNPKELKKPEPGAIIIGNEGKGISQEIIPFINHKITIPGKGDAESLNAAVAAGILMSYLRES